MSQPSTTNTERTPAMSYEATCVNCGQGINSDQYGDWNATDVETGLGEGYACTPNGQPGPDPLHVPAPGWEREG